MLAPILMVLMTIVSETEMKSSEQIGMTLAKCSCSPEKIERLRKELRQDKEDPKSYDKNLEEQLAREDVKSLSNYLTRCGCDKKKGCNHRC